MVQGVGARVGLAILGVVEPDQLIQVILSEDKAAIIRTPGVGPKLATRIISELKDKVGGTKLSSLREDKKAGINETAESKTSKLKQEAASGLVNLGFSLSEALNAVSGSEFSDEKNISVEELIRIGLRKLSSVNITHS